MTLIATALGAHNDAVMLAFFLLSCYFLQHQKLFWGLLALIIAAHVKLTALIWFPAVGLWILSNWGWQRAIRVGLGTSFSGFVLSWFLYAPFGGWQTLQRMLEDAPVAAVGIGFQHRIQNCTIRSRPRCRQVGVAPCWPGSRHIP